jgi:hypothetical protein
MQKGGVDIIELGVPFSDPIADGPVIQETNTVCPIPFACLVLLYSSMPDRRSQCYRLCYCAWSS